jgi:hypothetical protein
MTSSKSTRRSNVSGLKKNSRKQNPRADGDYSAVLIVPPKYGWAPPRLRTQLRFRKSVGISNNGFAAANLRFSPTFAYDIDPSVGSTAMPGFTEYGGIYRFYRVTMSKIVCSISNREAFPILAYIAAVNADPGVNYSSAVAGQYMANFWSRKKMLGAISGNAQGRLGMGLTVSDFGGASNLGVLDTYVGSTGGASPTNNVWWTVGVVSDTANLTTLGAYFEIDIEVELEFFELQSPSS